MAITNRSVCTHTTCSILKPFTSTQYLLCTSDTGQEELVCSCTPKCVDCKCLSMHVMYHTVLLYKGAMCYTMTKRHSFKEVQYLCTVNTNKKKLQPLSQSDKLKTKMKSFYLFLYYGEIQRETVARKCCNLTLNLCTFKYLCTKKKKKKHIRTRFRVSVQT